MVGSGLGINTSSPPHHSFAYVDLHIPYMYTYKTEYFSSVKHVVMVFCTLRDTLGLHKKKKKKTLYTHCIATQRNFHNIPCKQILYRLHKTTSASWPQWLARVFGSFNYLYASSTAIKVFLQQSKRKLEPQRQFIWSIIAQKNIYSLIKYVSL